MTSGDPDARRMAWEWLEEDYTAPAEAAESTGLPVEEVAADWQDFARLGYADKQGDLYRRNPRRKGSPNLEISDRGADVIQLAPLQQRMREAEAARRKRWRA